MSKQSFDLPNLCDHGNNKDSCVICDTLNKESQEPDLVKERDIEGVDRASQINSELGTNLESNNGSESSELRERSEEWMSNREIADLIDRSNSAVRRAVSRYRESNPDWFHIFQDASGSVVEKYSPELIGRVKEVLPFLENAPEGWLPLTQAAGELHTSPKILKGLIGGFRESHGDGFGMFKDNAGRSIEYYAPELLSEISDSIRATEPPEGWVTGNALGASIGVNYNVIKRIAEQFQESHTQWFQQFRNASGQSSEHYAPELVATIRQELKKRDRDSSPEGWMTSIMFANNIGANYKVVRRIANQHRDTHPEWFGVFKSEHGRVTEHYAPELMTLITDEIARELEPPSDWVSSFACADELGYAPSTVRRIASEFRELNSDWIKKFKGEQNRFVEYYAPELIEEIKKRLPQSAEAPAGWKTMHLLAAENGVSEKISKRTAERYRETNPEWFKMYKPTVGAVAEYYAPELVDAILNEISTYTEAPPGWDTNESLAASFGCASMTLKRTAERYRETNPEWFKMYKGKSGRKVQFYAPELAKILADAFKVESSPDDWMTNNAVAESMSRAFATVKAAAETYRPQHPEWFRNFKTYRNIVTEHYAPELILKVNKDISNLPEPEAGWKNASELMREFGDKHEKIKEIADTYRETHSSWFQFYQNDRGRRIEYYAPELIDAIRDKLAEQLNTPRNQMHEAEAVLERLTNSETAEARNFKELINLFGSSNSVDILYRLHPSFRGIPPERVSGTLAQYLGDFLLLPPGLNIDRLDRIDRLGDYLSDEDLRQGFLEVVKTSCLGHYQEQRRQHSDHDAVIIIREYFKNLRQQIATIKAAEVGQVVDDAEQYYISLYQDLEKPDHVVSQLREGRVFPDINQRINIKEVADKQKMLISDEMGLGKSASAVLSKEYLGVRCALVVVPSNVISTWQRYLSDEMNSDGVQVGYFNKGQAPRVLTVDTVEDLEGADVDSYEYILLSQERLNDRHMAALEQVDYDMLVVDEVHKLKNVMTGKRSQHALDLAKRIEGDDQYLVMLSGTPIPNKVEDIALELKMLYPEKFEAMKSEDLVRSIIYGDLVEVRNLLVPRMQLKRLQESLDMPPLEQRNTFVDLSSEEEEVYTVLLEEDEMTAAEKIAAMRKFLLNPELLETTPRLMGSKVKALKNELQMSVEQHGTTIVYVNGYVEGVIRGEKAIIEKLDIPQGVEIQVIDGTTPQADRQKIQQRIHDGGDALVVFVSGQTADVGLDFSRADHVIFYNEPWTAYDKAQQLGRVYREGHDTPLESNTLVVRKTIEDGIHRYIAVKQKAVEKLLKGVPRTEMENRLLERSEAQPDQNLEVNPELAEYYFSAWERMIKIFGHVREMGEEDFKRFLDSHGEEYANCYTELGGRTYQANNSRFVASVISEMVREHADSQEQLRILDIASGPEMLKKHLPEDLQGSVISLDINEHHFQKGSNMNVVGSFSRLPFRNASMDYCNLALALHYTRFVPSRGDYERLQVLTEMNRVLKPGGRGTISIIFNIEFKDFVATKSLVEDLGFRVVDEYTGDTESGDKYRAHVLTLEKVEDIPEIQDIEKGGDALVERIDKKKLEGLKLKRQKGDRLKNSRRVINEATLRTSSGDERQISMELNEHDRRVYVEEQSILKNGLALKSRYRRIEKIPEDELKSNGFSRIIAGKRFILFKKIENGEGAVVVR